ncbi:DUF4236 domain-containing protein [Hyphomicrobium sp.]|uniref:DUF4236 domain-containing protein n=1 Tax=Hyphomicrobium sp. TaxID=82 RepID=UPI001DBC5EC9|nr:DUF4236 domain-containing protein [Hyphomicrobium sp.]MBY0558991.1 DUF4236 domain-containing protein [Hyphomicrobium sp.]
MGYFRFRKTISILPGVRINLSKTGVSGSLGGNGATLNVGKKGEQVTLGIPGTGLSYRTPLSTTLIILLVVVAIAIGVAYIVSPTTVTALLHWWQPRWF